MGAGVGLDGHAGGEYPTGWRHCKLPRYPILNLFHGQNKQKRLDDNSNYHLRQDSHGPARRPFVLFNDRVRTDGRATRSRSFHCAGDATAYLAPCIC
jgi:hypothetical protein